MVPKALMPTAIVLMAAVILGSCKKDDPTPTNTSALHFVQAPQPPGFPPMILPNDQQMSEEGIELGRQLYYDTRLSQGGPQQGNACATCHNQQYGFSSFNASGTPIIPHVNLGWSEYYLWNGKVQGDLEDVLRFEVSEFFQVDPSFLETIPEYADAFEEIFGTSGITQERIALVMSQFMRSQVSYNSKYDQWVRGEANFTDAEFRGYQLFFSEKGDCFHCHQPPLFTDQKFHNIGLDSVFVGVNQGRGEYTGDPLEMGTFKTPTLRNVAVRNPYMHDGRFTLLRQVLQHYSLEVKETPSLDPLMSHNGTIVRNFSQTEIDDLIAFIETLTDPVFLSDSTLSKP
ncbi:MAG: hypothetical protein LPK46_09370 [Bacteroidota bacterium]|nr:hypothetical protein [Bacteroidota bacterium]MDX5447654.1 hypothetical protein [Bacteroidota bacterium]MDX5506333.1 hypothetical protein [Bacteroidota bacterium]